MAPSSSTGSGASPAAASAARPTTPPPSDKAGALAPSTPEHVRLMQQNRLRAKARIQQLAAAQHPHASATTSMTNTNGKRPAVGPIQLEQPAPRGGTTLTAVGRGTAASLSAASAPSSSRNAADSGAPGGGPAARQQRPGQAQPPAPAHAQPLRHEDRIDKYIEYDLSKLHNSKGGFLVDEEAGLDGVGAASSRKTAEEVMREREKQRERQRLVFEPGMVLDPQTELICRECGSREIDDQLKRVFGVFVCRACTKKMPEKYSLLTKTEVKEDYLLTDSELKDEELLPHLLKANPHKATYSNMMLYLRMQVEEYAFSDRKWGSEANLDAEFERREEEKSRKRGRRFEQGLRQLRKRTRDNVWQRRKDEEHVHEFVGADAGGGEEGKQVCRECGYEIEVEVF